MLQASLIPMQSSDTCRIDFETKMREASRKNSQVGLLETRKCSDLFDYSNVACKMLAASRRIY